MARPGPVNEIGDAKSILRRRLLAGRRERSRAELDLARAAIRLACLEVVEARAEPGATVCAYVPLATEPGSTDLLSALDTVGYRVLVPVLLPDRDLDWVVWSPADGGGPSLTPAAISSASVVLVPALAVDRHGWRLGRGGGSYDRALARVAASAPSVALLFDDELVDEVPHGELDQPVRAAVTPQRVVWF